MSVVPLETTARLARRVLAGEVVFFVGSGFSIDSEGNDAKRLVGRLLAGLLGLGTTLADANPHARNEPSRLLDGLGRIFGLEGARRDGEAAREPARCMTAANLQSLAREYYSFNDWSVSALGALSGELLLAGTKDGKPDSDECVKRRAQLAERALQLGNFLLSLIGDPVPFEALNCRVLAAFASPTARGKALFLDMMGFATPAIMAGTPRESDDSCVGWSYGGRLRPRHHALARLAREGLTPATVTTNYDLLLEGAYRLAGFVERCSGAGPDLDGARARFSRIAGAQHFFSQGGGYRAALLLKIHGCVEAYRDARALRLKCLEENGFSSDASSLALDAWSDYLPSLVFTYREIQTWRGDAWSRDLIRTLLRTHTIALCGYSGADPVMHSTFRDVYEERAATLRGAGARADMGAENATVFFFGIKDKREFHSLEILRAATVAAGLAEVKLVEHPNNIEFSFAPQFPSIDDHFRWLVHRVSRELQRQALRTHLHRIVPSLLDRECRDKELAAVLARFDELCQEEERLVYAACAPTSKLGSAERSRRFERVVSWTWHFVPGLLRELGLADAIDVRHTGHRTRRARRPMYYQPISDHPEWAAWAVVVELGLRTLIASLDSPETRVAAEESAYAAVSFTPNASEYSPVALCVRLAGLERSGRTPQLTGAFRLVRFWELAEREVPWPRQQSGLCPDPKALFAWAGGTVSPTRPVAKEHLGLS